MLTNLFENPYVRSLAQAHGPEVCASSLQAAAVEAIESVGDTACPQYTDMLCQEMAPHLGRISTACSENTRKHCPETGSMLETDATFADYIECFGDAGRTYAGLINQHRMDLGSKKSGGVTRQ